MNVKCPRCGKEIDFEINPFRPFCSHRCKYADLGDWLGESYSVPGEKVEKVDKAPESKDEPGDR